MYYVHPFVEYWKEKNLQMIIFKEVENSFCFHAVTYLKEAWTQTSIK